MLLFNPIYNPVLGDVEGQKWFKIVCFSNG